MFPNLQALLLKGAAVLSLLAAIAGLSVGLYEQRQALTLTRTQLDEQIASVAALRASHAQTAASVMVLQRKSRETQASVKAALASEPSFRDSAVPAGVAQRLCERLSCTP
jgi:hypothetical protein